jgi:hypothetical protein
MPFSSTNAYMRRPGGPLRESQDLPGAARLTPWRGRGLRLVRANRPNGSVSQSPCRAHMRWWSSSATTRAQRPLGEGAAYTHLELESAAPRPVTPQAPGHAPGWGIGESFGILGVGIPEGGIGPTAESLCTILGIPLRDRQRVSPGGESALKGSVALDLPAPPEPPRPD